MKKSSVVLINLFLSICCVRAMDNDSTKAEQKPLIEYKNSYDMTPQKRAIKGHEHIVYMSFRDIRHSVESLSTEKQKEIGLKLSQCAAFTIAMLPFELRYHVIKEVADGDEHIANEFFCMPILQAFELYAEVQRHCPLKIVNRELSVFDLWRLPKKKRDRLISMLKESIFKRIEGRDNALSEQEVDELMNILPEDFASQGLNVNVVHRSHSGAWHRFFPGVLGLGITVVGISSWIAYAITPTHAAKILGIVGVSLGPTIGVFGQYIFASGTAVGIRTQFLVRKIEDV